MLTIKIDLVKNNSNFGAAFWRELYNKIFKTNSAIEGLENSGSISGSVKTTTTRGEAKVLAGIFYFYLVNLYGEVPLALTTDPKLNTFLPRSSINSCLFPNYSRFE